jgi:hypothetical protein
MESFGGILEVLACDTSSLLVLIGLMLIVPKREGKKRHWANCDCCFVYPPKLEIFLSSFAAPAVNILLETAASPKFFPPTHNFELYASTLWDHSVVAKTHKTSNQNFKPQTKNSHLPKETSPKFSLHLFFFFLGMLETVTHHPFLHNFHVPNWLNLVGLSSRVSVDFVTQCWYP